MLSMWRISWRNMIQHKKRFAISVLGIMVGIAFVTSMLIADRTTNDVFHYYEQMYVADADYWVLSDDHTYDEEQISSILKHPDVTGSLLALDKQTFFEVEGDHSLNQRAVRITGVQDQTSSLLKLPVIEGRLDNQGLVIPDVVAKLLNKKVGDTIRFSGLGEAKVSAIVEYTQLLSSPSDWKSAESSSFRVMAPLDLLREWTGLDHQLSYMRFQTNDGGEQLFQSLQKEFKDADVFVQPVVADDRQSNDIGGLYTFFYLIAGLSMFMSGFIVFNMIYTSVMERKKEFAIMKSFGYTQGSVSKLMLIEVLILSCIGTAIGVPIGVWLGDVFMQTLLGVFAFDMVYSLDWQVPVVIAVIVGIVFPVLFSLFPIYHAGKTSVLLTLKSTTQTSAPKKRSVIRAVIGIGLLSFVWVDHPAAYLAILASMVLLFPFFLLFLNRLLAPLLKLVFGYPGHLSAQHVTQQLNRNANTAAILAVGIAVILLLSAVIESAPDGYEREIRQTYGGDLRVTSEAPWTKADQEKLSSYEAVERVEPMMEAAPLTWETADGEKRQFSLIGVEEKGPSFIEGDNKGDLYQRLSETPSIVLGERAFDEWGGRIGESVYLNAPSGRQQLQVIDVVKTSHHSGYVAFVDQTFLQEDLGWAQPLDILLTLKDKGAGESLRDQLWEDFGQRLSKVKTVEDEIKSTTSAFTGMNELISMMLIFIMGLASIGTANTLLMNTLERTSEIGTMRALGLTKQQVRKMIVGEGVLIGLTGVIGGILFGVILLYISSQSDWLGGFVSFQLQFVHLMLAVIAGIALSLAASWISSATASKIEMISSLKEG
ncbi:FtsX-like permease family protein [Bacillus altitudinis]|uniref:FtsX-like permease family protein n=1 Tax=Bacillus altitudinis TaxID=293387 RepID=UPI000370B9DC|nr:FtsX-like permease family protein [Bacillus altitudinis]KAJ0072291.1 FtsX-like permease family protein [Bacillus altitudinis]MCM3230191.1 FtsX-like permease family protein [Bacillus altitudinis]QSI44746.1 FtsX-like permease family protein [Bacillus altitudinis]